MASKVMEEMTTLDLDSPTLVDKEAKVLPEPEDIQIDVIDDTPPEDRGKEPMTAVPEADEDELKSYSTKVKARIEKLTRAYHDERRAKEQLSREHQEAVNYAQAVNNLNRQLSERTTASTKNAQETWKAKAKTDLDSAKAKYKIAYESADPDQIIEAQEGMSRATMRHEWAQNQQPAAPVTPAAPLQSLEKRVEQVFTAPPPDPKAADWASKNTWFGKDRQMTSLAYGVHEELISNGVNPTRDSDEYYAKINSAMRKRFPDYEWGDKHETASRPRTVVASVTRTASGKRVSLTQSQVAIAKRLNIPLAEYAKQVSLLQGGTSG